MDKYISFFVWGEINDLIVKTLYLIAVSKSSNNINWPLNM